MVGFSLCEGIYGDSRDITYLKPECYERVVLSVRRGREKERQRSACASRCEGWWSRRRLSAEWVGLRFGLRQLSYQHCFREGQPASLLSPPLFISSSPAQFSIIFLLLHYVLAAATARLATPTPVFAHLYSLSHSSLSAASLIRNLPTQPSCSSSQAGVYELTAPSLRGPLSETSTFTALNREKNAGRLNEVLVLLAGRWMYVHISTDQAANLNSQLLMSFPDPKIPVKENFLQLPLNRPIIGTNSPQATHLDSFFFLVL